MAFKFMISLDGLTGLGVALVLVSKMVGSQLSELWSSCAELLVSIEWVTTQAHPHGCHGGSWEGLVYSLKVCFPVSAGVCETESFYSLMLMHPDIHRVNKAVKGRS